jgi:hypothetical protein
MTLSSEQKDELADMTITQAVVEDRPIYLKEHAEHVTFAINNTVYMRNSLGVIEVKVCSECGYEDVRCLHLENDVDTKALKLNCLLCGA